MCPPYRACNRCTKWKRISAGILREFRLIFHGTRSTCNINVVAFCDFVWIHSYVCACFVLIEFLGSFNHGTRHSQSHKPLQAPTLPLWLACETLTHKIYFENLNELLVRIFFVISHIFQNKITNEQKVILAYFFFIFSQTYLLLWPRKQSFFFFKRLS